MTNYNYIRAAFEREYSQRTSKRLIPENDFVDQGVKRVRTAKERFLEEIEDDSETVKVKAMHEAYMSLGEDTYEVGTAIRVLKHFPNNEDNTTWWYVAIKNVHGKWNVSGGRESTASGCTWHDLKVWLVTTGEPTTEISVLWTP